MPERCPAKFWHGPGHQSSTQCRLEAGHAGPHEAVYGSARQLAHWNTGAYTGGLRELGIQFNPESYPEDIGMSGFFDEPPEEES